MSPLRRVLVANRGEIALRIARTCHALGMEVAGVHVEAERDAAHVVECDVVREVPSYLDAGAVVEAARACGADAVHPGYGFLAENEAFADAVREAGLVFVGPPSAAIRTMGSKTAARAAMEAAGVPVVPGSAAGSPDELLKEADRIGFPLLVKAVAGGGGKGMTVVRERGQLSAAARVASTEAEQAFGDGSVYLEKLLERPRHVEIQVFADSHGTCVSLGERECSIQRRHQKIVEEAPSPAVGPELRARLGEAAVAAARSVEYEGAGTVEFLLADDGTFWFLEMNTRLQVEHPVTEWVSGLDLVRLQLEVAAGGELPPEACEPELRGHAIECRVYAEDPEQGHLPQAGPLLLVREPFGPGVRVDSALREGDEVTVHYDPMLAKLSTWGRDRREAAARMREALSRFVVLGVRTNVDHLADVVAHPAFLAGDTTTAFLEAHLPDWSRGAAPPAAFAATALPATRTAATPRDRDESRVADPWRSASGFRLGGAS